MQQRQFIWGLDGLHRFGRTAHARDLRTVVTIGSFDGVHLGHQQILERVTARAQESDALSAVIIFEPQPHEYFAKETVRPRLMRLREKVNALFTAGIDTVVCLRFNQALRELTADRFIRDVLVQGLRLQHLEIGDDFKFGCDRRGDFNLLCQVGQQLDFSVANSQTFLQEGARVSSTRIRELMKCNHIADASNLLGRPYSIYGRVIYGRQLGRTINTPTANVGLGRYSAAVNGVYAVRVTIDTRYGKNNQSRQYDGVANVGIKPTLSGNSKPVLEVHIFDFNKELYGQFIQVTFLHFLRKEMKFGSLPELQAQIEKDCLHAQALLS